MTATVSGPTPRRVFLTVVLAVAVTVLLAGGATAHNPACHQTAGEDGPHYDDDPRTGSQAAFEQNPTLGGELPEHANGAESCSVGNSQSPHADD